MKKITSIIAAAVITLSMLMPQYTMAQSPQKMSYQSVVRNATGDLVTESPVGIQISILQGSILGTAEYVETHSATTNVNGLVSLEIGMGTVITGIFSGIDWGNGPHFVKTEIDPSGGVTYNMSGTSELLSVPYALYAKRVENDSDEQELSVKGDTIFISNGNYILLPGLSLIDYLGTLVTIQVRLDHGETPLSIFNSGVPLESIYGNTYQGGLIFYLNTSTGYGLVSAPSDQSGFVEWGCLNTSIPGADGTGIGTGSQNTSDIVTNCTTAGIAAQICDTLTVGIYSDWFLPSQDELNEMYLNLELNGFGNYGNAYYWSSTEISSSLSLAQSFTDGFVANGNKNGGALTRAVRAF